MSLRHFTAAFVVCVATGVAAGQSVATHTYKSPDGTFEFKYADPLVLCQKSQNGQDWEPKEECKDYGSLCEQSSSSGGALVCLSCSSEKYQGTNLVTANFLISEAPRTPTESRCLADLPQRDWPTPNRKVIHGVTFTAAHHDGVAAGTSGDTYAYRSFHNSKCYELVTTTESTNPANFDPGVVQPLPQSLYRRIVSSLQRALNSFRFLQ